MQWKDKHWRPILLETFLYVRFSEAPTRNDDDENPGIRNPALKMVSKAISEFRSLCSCPLENVEVKFRNFQGFRKYCQWQMGH